MGYLTLKAIGALCLVVGVLMVAGAVLSALFLVAKVLVVGAAAVFAVHFVAGASRSLRNSRARELPPHDPPG